MAVDLSLLLPEEPVLGDPPSPFVWTIVFFMLILIGVFAVLLLWPKYLPTHSWKFWTRLVLFPVGFSSFVVMRRFTVAAGELVPNDWLLAYRRMTSAFPS